ncbi:MAG: AAA family ATPase, partial [Pseudomonadales bacterium]|nr:AAA family ATPase [Pseudomonadales bacterium]
MSEALVQSMLAGKGFATPPSDIQLVETHISWIVLADDHVYKLKKPVDLGFVDFSTLPRRKHFCEEELRLNRRAAPDIYLDIIPISGSETAPAIGDDSAPFAYALRMRRFDQDGILDNLARRGELDADVTSKLAAAIANFHKSIDGEATSFPFDDVVEHNWKPVETVLNRLNSLVASNDERKALDRLRRWCTDEWERLRDTFRLRLDQGFVRECHGDLHLANILYERDRCIPFDCLEFDPGLRWIDTASDLAFTVMDLDAHGLHEHSRQLLVEYLEHTGDYELLDLLRYYLVYRALVRAMVDAIRSTQDESHARELHRECDNYLQMALEYTEPGRTALVMMCGFSGTGKTTIARHLATRINAIQIRSDVERKRLFGVGLQESSHDHNIDIYTEAADKRTFAYLEKLAENICRSHYPVLVDATFIDIDVRRQFESLADRLGIPWSIVFCDASPDTVAERLQQRRGDASEAGIRQYESQREAFCEFDSREAQHVITVDTECAQS